MTENHNSTTTNVSNDLSNEPAIINPHNPEFITKKPWYLGSGETPTLDHQADQRTEDDKRTLTLANANELLTKQRSKLIDEFKKKKFKVGMWVEALKKNKKPYRMAQIIRIAKNGTEFDLKFDEDGAVETNIKMSKSERMFANARIRMMKTIGNRSSIVQFDDNLGKETYDSKRDKYHGYDVTGKSHMEHLREKFETRENIRKQIRLNKQDEHNSESAINDKGSKGNTKKDKTSKFNAPSDSDSDYDSDADNTDSEDEFVQRDEDARVHTSRLARQGGVGGQQMKVTARNLRIREDTAKYLRNLDPNSAYYDPKSRSMRDNPNPEMDDDENMFKGDNFARISGDAIGFAQTQVFAWDAMERTSGATGGVDMSVASSTIHPQANPSQAEILRKKYTTQVVDLKKQQKKAVLDKYGGAEHLDGDDGLAVAKDTAGSKDLQDKEEEERRARLGVKMHEEQYTRDGKVIKPGGTSSTNAHKFIKLKSKYEEDIFTNGHNTVWGSYFHIGAFRWGYADDHSLMRNSYCTGPNGRILNDEANEMKYGTGTAGSAALAQAREMLKAIPLDQRTALNNSSSITNSKLYGEANQFTTLDKDKVRAALKKQQEEMKSVVDKKRKYNSMNTDVNVTEEDMEAYRLTKDRSDDPMANVTDEVLEYK